MRIGDRIRDKVSGFQGIATGLTEYLNGCRQFLVSPETLGAKGEPIKGQWIDEQTLEVVEGGVFADPFSPREPTKAATAGGPSSPSRRDE